MAVFHSDGAASELDGARSARSALRTPWTRSGVDARGRILADDAVSRYVDPLAEAYSRQSTRFGNCGSSLYDEHRARVFPRTCEPTLDAITTNARSTAQTRRRGCPRSRRR